MMFAPKRKRRRLARTGPRDDKSEALYQAANVLLAARDYDRIGVSEIAAGAKISVGSMYQRFPDKETLLDSVVVVACTEMQRNTIARLDPALWSDRGGAAKAIAIINEMSREISDHAGVIRAAIKRGHLDRRNLAPLNQWREALSDCAVVLLLPYVEIEKPEWEIRCAMQMAQAAALDALVYDTGPMRADSDRMRAHLCNMLADLLSI